VIEFSICTKVYGNTFGVLLRGFDLVERKQKTENLENKAKERRLNCGAATALVERRKGPRHE
jgi:hypothetical protein